MNVKDYKEIVEYCSYLPIWFRLFSDVSNKDVEKVLLIALKETEKLLHVPEDFENFLDDIIEIIKDLQTSK